MNEKPKILIADDSEINRALLKEILGDGYDYLEAEDGAAAVELMRQRTDISLLLLDLMMPGMDGFDVLRVMKYHAWLDEIPVIVISAAEDTANIERAYDLGVADYIRRPFERIMILRRVKNILMLYAKQKRLTRLVTDQVYEKEHNSVLMISILSHVVEFRNSESGLHVLHIRTLTDLLLHRLVQKTDRYQLDESDIARISTASALHDIGNIVDFLRTQGYACYGIADMTEHLLYGPEPPDRTGRILINLAPPDRADDVVRLFERSSFSCEATFRALDAAARAAGLHHEALLMVDMGDMREGIPLDEAPALLRAVAAASQRASHGPGAHVAGIGVNLGCLYGTCPDDENMARLEALAPRAGDLLGHALHRVSLDGSIFWNWFARRHTPP